jgi:hypothetical protein
MVWHVPAPQTPTRCSSAGEMILDLGTETAREDKPGPACSGSGIRDIRRVQVRHCKALRCSPAMAAGMSERLWDVGDTMTVVEDWEAQKALFDRDKAAR